MLVCSLDRTGSCCVVRIAADRKDELLLLLLLHALLSYGSQMTNTVKSRQLLF